MRKNKTVCQCCGKKYSTKKFGYPMYTICPNCDWENDPFTLEQYEISLSNLISIQQARSNIIKFGNIYGIENNGKKKKVKLYIERM